MSPAHPTQPEAERAIPWPQVLALCLAVAAGYANSLSVPFLLDDPQPDVPLDYSSRALVWATFALNRALSGGATWSYHVFNALVHLTCGLLLFGVLRRGLALAAPQLAVQTRTGLAFVTALLWLCHPLQTAAITYLSQRAEALGALFYLLVLYAFLRALASTRPLPWQVASIVALALGFATKETIATAPFLLLGFDATLLAAGPWAALRKRAGYYAALLVATTVLVGVFLAPVLSVANPTAGLRLQAFGPLEYARTEAGVLLHYLRLVFWPQPLCFDYGWPIARELREYVLQSVGLVGLLLGLGVLLLRRSWIGFLGACFFLVLAPTSSFVPIQDPAFEHRLYLALAFPLLLGVVAAAWICARVFTAWPRLPPALALGATLGLTFLSVRRNQDYRSAVRLFQLTAEQVPHNARAHANLGAALLGAGRTGEALVALEAALRLDPTISYCYLNLGKAYLELGQVERAIPHMERAVTLLEDSRFRDALASTLFEHGEPARALPHFEKACEQNPSDAGLRYRLACTLGALGRGEEALRNYEEALRLDPRLQEAHVNLATLLLERGRAREALEHSERAAALAPDSFEELFGLAQALRALGRFDEALAEFRAAGRLAPDRPEPLAGLAQTVLLKPEASAAERAEALRAAENANALVRGAQADVLALLAECQAALGHFEGARLTLEQALALEGVRKDPAWTTRLRGMLEDYQRRTPR